MKISCCNEFTIYLHFRIKIVNSFPFVQSFTNIHWGNS